MKKIIAAIIVLTMLVCCFTIPCTADTSAGVYLKVKYTKSDGMINLSGTMAVSTGKKWATIYLLNPGFTRDDIPTHSAEKPAFSHCAEIAANDDGTFEYEFKHSGDPGVYTLYFTTGYAHITRVLDTTQDIEIENGQLEALRGLPTTFEAPSNPDASTKVLFEEKVAELFPYEDEMPVVQPRAIDGYLKEVFVDVKNGDDATATGTKESPYKTINAALSENPPESGMVLFLREGTYSVEDGLNVKNINATDELPFIISNYDNEEVIISGGTEIKGSDFEKVSDQDIVERLAPQALDNIMVVDLKEKYGLTDFGSITAASTPRLYVDELEYTIARWPNGGTTSMREYTEADGENGVVDSGMITHAGSTLTQYPRTYSKRATERNAAAGENIDTDTGFEFCVEDIRPFSWVNTGDIWVQGRFYAEWVNNAYQIKEFNPEKRSLRTAEGINYGARYSTGNTFYYFNVLEELDSPGEWVLDKKEGKLYVYPSGDINNSKITYQYADIAQMWKLENCKSVIINGIKFEHCSGIALNIAGERTDGVVVQNCSFENVGLGVYVDGKYSGVINSSFKNLEGMAIRLDGTDDKSKLVPDRKFAQNNTIYNSGGIRLFGVGQIISHNYISNVINHCIYVDGVEAVVEYNEIVAGPRQYSDAGAIYLDGANMWDRGHHIRYNYIHDSNQDTRAIYFDDMISECHAYGNIIDGSWIQIHTGSDNTVYNNIFLNFRDVYSGDTLLGPIFISARYYHKALEGANEWKNLSLEYELMTNNLLKPYFGSDAVNKTITGPYAERYPRLKKWAELMYQRIAEYEENGKTVESAITSSIKEYEGKYTHIHRQKETILLYEYWKEYSEPLNLNQYLSSSRDNYLANNVMIDTDPIFAGLPNDDGYFYNWYNGILRTEAANNVHLTNPFTNKDYSDENAYNTIRQSVSGFKSIPFDKIGPSEEDYSENKKAVSISPADTTEIAISANDLSFSWAAVEGAQEYIVEIATDPEFTKSNIVATSEPTYDLSCTVNANLESDKVYYWRIMTEATHKYATGSIEISDTFKFKTLVEGQEKEGNQVGVTVYSVDDMTKDNFKVTTYAYNRAQEAKDATIYIACYDKDNRLISAKSKTVNVGANTFTEKYVFDFKAPNTKTIKFFVWSADGKMIPYTFVKTIK